MTRDEALAAANEVRCRGLAQVAAMTPREAAEAAWYPGHPAGSIEELEAEIVARRARQSAAQQPAA